jgi:hypothetical protein
MIEQLVSRFVVVKEGNKLLESRKTYFPNLELGLTIDDDVSDDDGFTGSLYISKSVTRERLKEFLDLPLIWDRKPFADRPRHLAVS